MTLQMVGQAGPVVAQVTRETLPTARGDKGAAWGAGIAARGAASTANGTAWGAGIAARGTGISARGTSIASAGTGTGIALLIGTPNFEM